MSERELLFSVTAADCDWKYSHGTGAGGQARNKSLSAVHCTHRASGAHAYSQDGRSQESNKSDSFVKMTSTPEFKSWHQKQVWKKLGVLDQVEASVRDGMDPANLKLEVKENGKWVTVSFDAPLDVDVKGLTVR